MSQQRVVPADMADASLVERAGRPRAAVDVDLALIRDPAKPWIRTCMNPNSGSIRYR
jgi:hypothetical protein